MRIESPKAKVLISILAIIAFALIMPPEMKAWTIGIIFAFLVFLFAIVVITFALSKIPAIGRAAKRRWRTRHDN